MEIFSENLDFSPITEDMQNVKALTECEVLEINRDELNEIIKRYPRIQEVLQNFFRQRVLDLFLACSPLFSSLTPEDREALFKRFRLYKVPEKTLLFRGGDPSDSLYMIKQGEVEIYTQNRNGKRVILAALRSGNFFGEIGVLLNRPRMAFARTTQLRITPIEQRRPRGVCSPIF